jgi:hypothetical protein
MIKVNFSVSLILLRTHIVNIATLRATTGFKEKFKPVLKLASEWVQLVPFDSSYQGDVCGVH